MAASFVSPAPCGSSGRSAAGGSAVCRTSGDSACCTLVACVAAGNRPCSYESGFDINTFLPPGTEITYAYDKLNGVFTRFQIIIFSGSDQDAAIPFYINYDSELYSPAIVGRFCDYYNEAVEWMISSEDSNTGAKP